MRPKSPPDYLAAYPVALVAQARALIEQNRLAEHLLLKYPAAHQVRNDRALYGYVQEIKEQYLRNTGVLSHVAFDSTLHVMKNALGMHTRVARVQGVQLKVKSEIRVAEVFKEMPAGFLRMIVVHELAHLKESQHNKAFYLLCLNMEPDYHQLEFDLRVYLCYLNAGGKPIWTNGHGKFHHQGRQSCHDRFPLSNFPPHAGEMANESLREFNVQDVRRA